MIISNVPIKTGFNSLTKTYTVNGKSGYTGYQLVSLIRGWARMVPGADVQELLEEWLDES